MTGQNNLWLPATLGRRQLLLGAGGVAALAACSDDKSTTKSTTGATTADTTGATTGDTTAATTAETTATTAGGAGKKGGTLRVGVVGSTNDLMDGQYIVARADQARMVTGWEPIANYDDDFNIAYDNSLAESIEATAPDLYVVRLKAGVEFHNGKTVSAEDLVYSFKRLTDPDLGIAPALSEFVDANSFKILDDLTVQITLLKPSVAFLNGMADYGANIVPVDYARFAGDPTTQVGTGAFKLKSFTPGSESVHVRHENYWGESYLDEVQIIDFSDQSALVNALTSGDIDVAIDVPYAQAGLIESNSDLVLLESQAGNWQTITMRVDMAPFDDVRVRQAMRLIVNREEMVQRVLSGHGRVGNDMYGVLDGSYPKDFPQREQDIEAAKALLKDAGQENLTIELFAPDDTAGLPEYATAFAEQAKAAGINVTATVLDGGTYWGAEYTQRVFATSYWSTRPFLNQVALGTNVPTATYPETHWPPAGSDWEALYNQAIAEVDQDKRYEIIRKMQQEEYDEGGNIIAYFQNLLDGHASFVQGAVARPNLLNFDHFGRGWKHIWLDQ
ncbi:MAG: ABC transporter substrate-binding protein [Ilumatobacteraceae bacterium]